MARAARSESHGTLLATKRPVSSAGHMALPTSCGFRADYTSRGKTTIRFVSTRIPELKLDSSVLALPPNNRLENPPGRATLWRNGNCLEEEGAEPLAWAT